MKYPTVIVNGVSVRFDDEGRYNLNDLHAAAVTNGQATESQRPGEFLKSKQVKAFVSELNDAKMIASVKSIKGGKEQGTWGHELIAIRYAAWLNPRFEIRVYETFREVVLNGLSAMNRLNRLDLLIDNEKKDISDCARRMNQWGVGGRKQILHTVRDRMASEIQLLMPGLE